MISNESSLFFFFDFDYLRREREREGGWGFFVVSLHIILLLHNILFFDFIRLVC